MRRFLTVFATVAIVASAAAAPVAAQRPSGPDRGTVTAADLQPTSVIHGNKSLSGRIAQSDPKLLARKDGAMVNVMIKFDADAIASYQGGIQGLQPTSPATTGKSLKENQGAVGAYSRYLGTFARTTRAAITRAVPQARLDRNFLTAFGGVNAQMPANKAKDLLKVKGVAAVMYDYVAQPLTDASPSFVGANLVWPSIGGNQRAGAGVKVGVLDTGIWPEHPSFTDPGIAHPGGTYGCEFGLSGHVDDPAFACNDKLIGAYAFLDSNLANTGPAVAEFCPAVATCSARDADGHGTHTTSTAAGRRLSSAVLFGVDRGPVSGIAPGAHVIQYRVCDSDGCFGSDSVNAVEQAIDDDVDVLNFSISGGSNPYSDAVELAFLDAYAAGILVNASAGNGGPGAGTANHAGPWVNTVGASTSDRHFVTTLHLTADGGATLNISGVTITAGISSPTPVVLASAAPYSDAICNHPATAGQFTGKVVVCMRGTNGRAEKGYNVSQGNAAGMILSNQNAATTDLETDNHWLPAVHVQYESNAVTTFVSGNTNVMAEWSTGVATNVTGDVMASFSSRGPLGDFLKPDVTAPGVQILAGHSPKHAFDPALGPSGENFQAIAGTSMSSPHAAGVAAILKDSHPNWTPGQIKSAMMTASTQAVLKEDGVTPADPFDRGAGSIRANRANKPTVTFNVTSAAYFSSAGDPNSRLHLNLPSINAPEMPGFITTTRTARNVSGSTQTINLSATGPGISVSPNQLVLLANQSKTFTVTIDAPGLADGQYFGQIKLDPQAAGANNAILPVAFLKGPGDVTLDHSCDSGTVADEATVECEITMTNFSSETANVSARVRGPNRTKLLLSNWSAGNRRGNGFVWNGALGPSLPPEINSLTTPGDGFVDISGLAGEGFYGDEDMGVYSGIDFFGGGAQWGDITYDTFSVTSNGYMLMGAGESADLDFVPQDMPDPTRPNTVLAPYWTDLDLADGGDIHIGVADDGIDFTFFVIQWEDAPIFGSCPPPVTDVCENRTFQIWLATKYFADTYNGGMSYITFEYPGAMGPGAGDDDGVIEDDGLNIGAEDANGTTAADLGIDVEPNTTAPCLYPPFDPCGGYYVDIGASLAGGTMTITYDVKGKRPGNHIIMAHMTSDVTVGRAKEGVHLIVTPAP